MNQEHEIRQEFSSYLSQWHWEIFATFTFYARVSKATAFSLVKRVINRNRKKFKKIKFAAVLFYCNVNGFPHVHSLFTSDQNYPNTLSRNKLHGIRSPMKWMDYYWRVLRLGTLDIEPVYHNRGICNYLSSRRNLNFENFDDWDFELYRENILMKLMDNYEKHEPTNSTLNLGKIERIMILRN